jgi:hypothetical protein
MTKLVLRLPEVVDRFLPLMVGLASFSLEIHGWWILVVRCSYSKRTINPFPRGSLPQTIMTNQSTVQFTDSRLDYRILMELHPQSQPVDERRKRVTVLLLRHGEREDEAMKRAMSTEERKRYSLLPLSVRREKSMDPALTRAGYEQANIAWKNILSALQRRELNSKVTIVCSPLRRCIGTALMMSPLSTSSKKSANLDWWSLYPLWNDKKTVPILVMNGLCSCASAIERFGGDVLRAIHAGYDIPCAVTANMSQNGCGTDNRFRTEVRQMMDFAKKSCDLYMLQFLGSQMYCCDRLSGKFSYHPLTEPLPTLNDDLVSSPRRGRDQDAIPTVKQVHCSTPPQDHQNCDCRSFLCTLNRAVQLSAANTSDAGDIVLIAVTHREGIRALVDHCKDAGEVVATPYCCIGSFTATVDTPVDIGHQGERHPTIQYAFHSVLPYSDFTVDYLRSITDAGHATP